MTSADLEQPVHTVDDRRDAGFVAGLGEEVPIAGPDLEVGEVPEQQGQPGGDPLVTGAGDLGLVELPRPVVVLDVEEEPGHHVPGPQLHTQARRLVRSRQGPLDQLGHQPAARQEGAVGHAGVDLALTRGVPRLDRHRQGDVAVLRGPALFAGIAEGDGEIEGDGTLESRVIPRFVECGGEPADPFGRRVTPMGRIAGETAQIFGALGTRG